MPNARHSVQPHDSDIRIKYDRSHDWEVAIKLDDYNNGMREDEPNFRADKVRASICFWSHLIY